MGVHDQGTVARVRRGPRLHWRATTTSEKPVVAVGLLHGYADHSERYAHVMDAWAERGIATVAIDLRGHGRSEGRRGHCERFEEFVDDAAELAPLLASRAPGVPAFLFAHSFGGLVATHSVLEDPKPWRGLLLSSPYYELGLRVPRAKLALGHVMSRVWPTLALASGLHSSDITHDTARAAAYDHDPLVFSKATVRWFTEALTAQQRAVDRAGAVTLPLYVVVGTADRIAKPAAARTFFDRASSADKTWDSREGLLHEVLMEPEWRPIADRMADWMLSRK